MSTIPDEERDVIVKHVTGTDDSGNNRDRWVILVGRAQRAELESQQNAFIFARLLADLNKRPVWILHESDDFHRLDPSSVKGCGCC